MKTTGVHLEQQLFLKTRWHHRKCTIYIPKCIKPLELQAAKSEICGDRKCSIVRHHVIGIMLPDWITNGLVLSWPLYKEGQKLCNRLYYMTVAPTVVNNMLFLTAVIKSIRFAAYVLMIKYWDPLPSSPHIHLTLSLNASMHSSLSINGEANPFPATLSLCTRTSRNYHHNAL